MTIQPLPRERLQRLARSLYALGERPLYEFLREIEAGAPLGATLESYARLAPLAGFIEMLGGRELEQARLAARRRA